MIPGAVLVVAFAALMFVPPRAPHPHHHCPVQRASIDTGVLVPIAAIAIAGSMLGMHRAPPVRNAPTTGAFIVVIGVVILLGELL